MLLASDFSYFGSGLPHQNYPNSHSELQPLVDRPLRQPRGMAHHPLPELLVFPGTDLPGASRIL